MVTLALWLLLAALPEARAGQAAGCEAGPYRDFDFWVGTWTVSAADGSRAGRNEIRREQAGCLLVERWQGAQGTTGTSMNYYDPIAGHWRQVWVSPGVQIDIAGNLEDRSMVLEGTITYLSDRRQRPFRGTWTPLGDGRVRQFFEEGDAGGSWTAWFEGFYARAGD